MNNCEERATQTLFEQNQITAEQLEEIHAYRNLNIFSIHNELKLLLYLSILMFTSGMGILIYQNIDTIGHAAILGLLLIVTILCFYFSFKKHPGLNNEEVSFANPLYDYLVLTAVILSCTFVGYLQFQYQTFGTKYNLATLVPTIISFACAYYFDNKSVLSIGITGLAASLGLSIDPKHYFENEIFNNTILSYIGLGLGFVLLLWSLYSDKINLKKHFSLVYLTFSLHLVSVSCIANLFEEYWLLFALILGIAVYYFYKLSFKKHSFWLFIFAIIYGYIGTGILFFKVLEFINSDDLFVLLIYITPVIFIISIIGFIKQIKYFNKKTSNDSLR